MWQVLVGDEATVTKVFQHILEVLSFSLPYQEKQKGNKTVRTETEVPKAVSGYNIAVAVLQNSSPSCHSSRSVQYMIVSWLHAATLTVQLMQASQAIAVLCAVPETGEVAKQLYSKLFTALLLRIGVSSTVDNTGKEPTCIRYCSPPCTFG